MKSLLCMLCAPLVIFPLISFGKTLASPLDDPDFVYSEDKIQAYMDRATGTRVARINEAFSTATGEGLRQAFCPYFADLWLGRDLDRVNAELVEILRSEDGFLCNMGMRFWR